MSDFESLKADQSFAGALLRSAARDAPSVRARRLAAASLGMAATASVVPSALAAGQALGATTQVVAPAGVSSVGALMVSKWLVSSFVIGVFASTGAITAYEVVGDRETPGITRSAERSSTRAPKQEPPPRSQAAVIESPTPVSDVSPAPTTSAAVATVTDASAIRSETPSRADQQPRRKVTPLIHEAPSLDAEIAWLEPARRSLRAKDGRQALASLDQARPHVRLLSSEAALLRIEALLLVGRRAEAERLAAPFLTGRSSSPHARRLRGLLDRP